MTHLAYSIASIKEIIHATGIIVAGEAKITALITDSRKVIYNHHGLFFALQGRRDGHSFIDEVYQAGIRSFVISNPNFPMKKYADANFLLVDDTLEALQQLVGWHRKQFNVKVIGITGSNGKTIVKEWLYQLLSSDHHIVRSPKSYNSQIGVPLSVWQLSDSDQLGIFEAGISLPGEMEALNKVIQPTLGILTNIREAHDEGFSSAGEKVTEKLKLFNGVEQLVYSPDHLLNYKGTIPGKHHFTWSLEGNKADLEVYIKEPIENRYYLRAKYKGDEIECLVPFNDRASVENATICWATMLAMGYTPAIADSRIEQLTAVRMRLELKNGTNNCSVIDDSYSSDISSLSIALDFLDQQNQHPKRTVILSDILQTGKDAADLYTRVASLLDSRKVNRLIGVGKDIALYKELFKQDTRFFENTEELLAALPDLHFFDETILVKGARTFGFERITKALTQKKHDTTLEINLNALEHNLNHYKSMLRPGVKLMAMVKAFSYGSGSYEIANVLQFNKVDYLAVAYADEGVALRKTGIRTPIMVMSPETSAFETMITHKLEPEIYQIDMFREFIGVLRAQKQLNHPIHIKIDTGMKRLGFEAENIDELIALLRTTKEVKVMSIFSHLVASDDEIHDDFTRHQISLFDAISGRVQDGLGYKVIRHISNTSGISRWPEAQFDMVRLGIGMYGVDAGFKNGSPLQNVATLKTTVSQVKHILPGETVGYSRNGKLPAEGAIATVKIGYADGYPRALGNGVGRMMVNGHIAPTVGSICMDMCMIDVTGIAVKAGDEVTVFNDQLSIEEVAKQLHTIAYEVLTNISQRVRREYYYE